MTVAIVIIAAFVLFIIFAVLTSQANSIEELTNCITNLAEEVSTLHREVIDLHRKDEELERRIDDLNMRLCEIEDTKLDVMKEELKQQQAMTDGMNSLFNYGQKLYGGEK